MYLLVCELGLLMRGGVEGQMGFGKEQFGEWRLEMIRKG